MKLSPFALGTPLTGIGVLILSPDAAMIRYIDLAPLEMTFWRGAAMIAVLTAMVFIAFGRGALAQFAGVFTLTGGLIAILLSLTIIGFVLRAERGDPGFTVVAVAATPLSAAIWCWFIYREPADRPTLIAMIIGGFAVCLGAYEILDTQRGDMVGFLGAFWIPIGMGLGFTLTRYLPPGQSPWAIYALAGVFTCVITTVIEGAPVWPASEIPVFLTSVLIVSAASFVLISVGPRYISAAQTSLMLLLETALSPIWVYWLLQEAPGPLTLVGGLILILTLIGQTLAQLHLSKGQNAQA